MSYMPKVGDKVRATCGESALVGSAADVYPSGAIRLALPGIVGPALLTTDCGWSFERIVEPVEFKPLMVVRLTDDALKVLVDDAVTISEVEVPPEFVNMGTGYWYGHGPSNELEFRDHEIQQLFAAGKADVLFEGVSS